MSVRFVGGPARGVQLQLARTPPYLRVVGPAQFAMLDDGIPEKWDALDQLDDDPAATESVHVYVLAEQSQPVVAFVCGLPRGHGGRTVLQESWYQHLPDVDGEQLRDRDAWQAWASAQPLPEVGARELSAREAHDEWKALT